MGSGRRFMASPGWCANLDLPFVAMAVGGAEAKRAYDAMLTMRKIDVAGIDRARAG